MQLVLYFVCDIQSYSYELNVVSNKHGFRLTASLTTKIGENVIDVHFGI